MSTLMAPSLQCWSPRNIQVSRLKLIWETGVWKTLGKPWKGTCEESPRKCLLSATATATAAAAAAAQLILLLMIAGVKDA